MISYIGGKSKMQTFIVPFIPKEVENFVEVFGGMAWIFFGMKL